MSEREFRAWLIRLIYVAIRLCAPALVQHMGVYGYERYVGWVDKIGDQLRESFIDLPSID